MSATHDDGDKWAESNNTVRRAIEGGEGDCDKRKLAESG